MTRGRRLIEYSLPSLVRLASGIILLWLVIYCGVLSSPFPLEGGNGIDVDVGTHVFEERRQLLERVCHKYTSDHFRAESETLSTCHAELNQFAIFWHSNQVSMICSLHKTGSNSWAAFLSLLSQTVTSSDSDGDSHSADTQLPALDCFPGCAGAATKLIVVRHPLERLLSAWRHVFHRHDGQGTQSGPSFGLHIKPSWPEFVELLLTNPSSKLWRHAVTSAGDHWEPYWRHCAVCHDSLRPAVIFKMEEMKQDLKRYLRSIGLDERLSERFPHLLEASGGHTSTLVQRYYGLLSKRQVRDLYELYKVDHELFGYDPEVFIAYARD